MKNIIQKIKNALFAATGIALISASSAQAAVLPADFSVDMTDFGVVALAVLTAAAAVFAVRVARRMLG